MKTDYIKLLIPAEYGSVWFDITTGEPKLFIEVEKSLYDNDRRAALIPFLNHENHYVRDYIKALLDGPKVFTATYETT